jgi:hypothetical protein
LFHAYVAIFPRNDRSFHTSVEVTEVKDMTNIIVTVDGIQWAAIAPIDDKIIVKADGSVGRVLKNNLLAFAKRGHPIRFVGHQWRGATA